MRLTTTTNVSVDGVMQGLGGPDEDRRGGFDRAGLAPSLVDTETGDYLDQVYGGAFLLMAPLARPAPARRSHRHLSRHRGQMSHDRPTTAGADRCCAAGLEMAGARTGLSTAAVFAVHRLDQKASTADTRRTQSCRAADSNRPSGS